MKLDFNYKFKTLEGTVIPERPNEEIEDKDGKKSTKKYPPFTLKTACVNVLLNTGLNQVVCPQCSYQIKVVEELSGEEKASRFILATKIYNGDGLVDVGIDDIKLVKDLIAKNYPPLTVGQAWSVLDPHEAEEKIKE